MMKRCLQKMQNCVLIIRFAVEPPGSNQEGQEDGRFFAAQLTDGLTINQKDQTRWTRPLQQRQHQSNLSARPKSTLGQPPQSPPVTSWVRGQGTPHKSSPHHHQFYRRNCTAAQMHRKMCNLSPTLEFWNLDGGHKTWQKPPPMHCLAKARAPPVHTGVCDSCKISSSRKDCSIVRLHFFTSNAALF